MKYKLIKSDFITINYNDEYIKLYRIKALKNFGATKKGDIGGYVQSEDNLSQYGNCWIANRARVYGNAWVTGDARIFGFARIYGEARVHDDVKVYDMTKIYGCARLYGSTRVYGNAEIYDNTWTYQNVCIHGSAKIHGESSLHGSVEIYDNADVYNVIAKNNVKIYGNAKIKNTTLQGNEEIYENTSIEPVSIVESTRSFSDKLYKVFEKYIDNEDTEEESNPITTTKELLDLLYHFLSFDNLDHKIYIYNEESDSWANVALNYLELPSNEIILYPYSNNCKTLEIIAMNKLYDYIKHYKKIKNIYVWSYSNNQKEIISSFNYNKGGIYLYKKSMEV